MRVGDYIRTENGIISKVKEIHEVVTTDNEYITTLISHDNGTCGEENVIKSSSNIIDLIEVGDYVNGDKVVNFMLNNNLRAGVIVDSSHYGYDFDEIKSIVTHEQFEAMQYKVGK